MKNALIVLIVWGMSGLAAGAQSQGATQPDRSAPPRSRIYKLEELTWPQIDAFDRERTLFILPVGMIEEHGPHLPVGADTLGVTHEATAASRRVSRALPDWNVVMMPPINYGQGGANMLGDMLVHPGTYAIRQSTLRSLVADVGGQLAQKASDGFLC
jgi:creatinine amidohydrolase